MDEFYNNVMSHNGIYSLMYSPFRVDFRTLEDQIIFIEKEKFEWAKDKSSFFYVWGWPGPDYNQYDISTYGKGWAFTKEELIESWKEVRE